jgi:hypothetical protein
MSCISGTLTRSNSVSIATRLVVGRAGFSSRPGGVTKMFFSSASRPALGITQPPSHWVPGVLTPRVKRSGHEADHSSASSAEVKNAWGYTSTNPYVFIGWCLVFTFTFIFLEP